MNLLDTMRAGKVYRRKDLESYSSSIDRELASLTQSGEVAKVAPGLYLKPEVSRFGPLPPTDHEVVRAFLDDNRFLLMSFNNYNTLGLGLTQLRNDTVVYNRKRHTSVNLVNKKFVFKSVREFPRKLSKEFLLVDLLNNLKDVGEDVEAVLSNLENKKYEFDPKRLLKMASLYGKIKTKNYLKRIYAYVSSRYGRLCRFMSFCFVKNGRPP